MLRLYNSLGKKIQTFKPREGKTVRLYTCGPTVYSRPHIGNYRTYIFEDALKRYLIYKGHKVLHTMNITDMDETIMKEVKKTWVPYKKLTAKYERLFRQDLNALGAMKADFYPHASQYAGKMAEISYDLLEKGKAYVLRGRVYFDLSKFRGYGELSGKRIAPRARRVLKEEYKRKEAGDFLLLRPCRGKCKDCAGQKSMKAEPAWNVQCAAMGIGTLGKSMDITVGGEDNCFNHHENTRAVANSLSGNESSAYWMHVRHLKVRGIKMSKSKGNAVLVPELAAKGYSAKMVRMLLLSRHYRKPMEFGMGRMVKVKDEFQKMQEGLKRIGKARGRGSAGFEAVLLQAKKEFETAMDDDFDTAGALRAASRFICKCERLAGEGALSAKNARKAMGLIRKFDSVLACLPI
ncbi:MAG: class I tRNA ligase family protein [Candidatus Micrarchaeota archaeon]|nr:class I tRNA ligase family protein [Candidatus Micrarchaeota archaeon]